MTCLKKGKIPFKLGEVIQLFISKHRRNIAEQVPVEQGKIHLLLFLERLYMTADITTDTPKHEKQHLKVMKLMKRHLQEMV